MEPIDWASFDTPFGPRTGDAIVGLLEKLDAADARVRARALQDLHRRLVAVGGGFGRPFLDAALAAVPVLGARLAAPGELAPQLGQLLVILGDVAAGNHRLHVARGLPIDGLARTDIGPARATQAAVASFAPAIRARLADDEPAVRTGAAFALAWLPGEAARSVPALIERVTRERNAVARASLLMALGYLGAEVDLLRASRREKAPIGTCAAIAAMLCDPVHLDEDLDVALAPVPKPVVAGFPFLDGAILRLRTLVIGGATIRRNDLPRHLVLLERLPPEVRPEAEGWAVEIAAAAGGPRAEPLDPLDLPSDALAVLRERAAMLRTGRAPNLYQAFFRAGLFPSIDANERALGVDPPGALDARVDGRPLWWWLHALRSGRIDEGRWLSLLTGQDALAILEDAASAPYQFYRDRASQGPFEFGAFADLLASSSSSLGVQSDALDVGIAKLRDYATKVVPSHQSTFAPWP